MLVSLHKGTAAMLASRTNLPGTELYSYANVFFCFGWKSSSLITKRRNSSTRLWLHVVLSRFDWLICVACSENFNRFEYNKKRQRHTLLESVLPRASSLMDVAIPSCKTKSTGFTTPDFEQGTFTTMIRTSFRRSSVGRASRKLSPSKTTSEVIVKVRR